MKKLVLIDGHSILNRAFYGVPELTNSKGFHTNAIYGFLNIMFKILEEEKPDYLAVAFDVHAPTFRHEIYKEYKGTRKPMPEELREQVPVMKEVLKAMKVVILEQPGLEADDILGTLAKRAERDGLSVALVSGDRDLLQIATDNIKIRIPKTKRGGTEIEDYYAEDVKALYGVTPEGFIELKALMGDTADNIPGVPKVGEKTAKELMMTYGSIEGIYSHIDEIAKKSIRESLAANRELCDLSKTLATIKTDCDLSVNYSDAVCEDFFNKDAYAVFKELEFKNFLSKFSAEDADVNTAKLPETVVLAEEKDILSLLEGLEKNKTELGLIIAMEAKRPFGAALSYAENGGYKNIFFKASREVLNRLKELTGKVKVSTFDIKNQYEYLCKRNIDKSFQDYFDVLIGAYLLNPIKNDYDIEAVAAEHMGLMLKGRNEVFGKNSPERLLSEDEKKVADYYGAASYVCLLSRSVLENKLRETDSLELMYDIEMPLSFVLYDMEREGVLVKPAELKAYGDALTGRINELEASIHRQAGEEFNINSPKQLGEILFEKMGIPGGKKTKTGYSTAADVLEKLSEEYPFVKDILEYRGLTKLKSTYADGLMNFVAEDKRIHTTFKQTITATGRLSSTDPNLQNIPMRTELGRRIRKVFVPKEGCVFVDADYSQIELRVLAHMSGDERLIDAYRQDKDIHRITASQVFHVPFDEVTPLQRRNAKAVNFGIVYGISSFGLSQDLSISRKEAQEYIAKYFETYPGIKEFLDKLVSNAREKGYSTTMYNRRRPVPELKNSNFMQRQFGERIAMNSPIQGTAADIIKIAMINVYRALKDNNLKSKLILQVHDELLIEAYEEEADKVKEILLDCMMNAASLKVSLEVDMHTGADWYEAK